jgi:hypothetical protein
MKISLGIAVGTTVGGNVLTLAANSNYYRPASTSTYKRPDGTSYYLRT